MSRLPHIVVLGGGPAGCGAAFQLRRTGKATVTLLERQPAPGGNAGSFRWGGQWLDYGSHRLHHTVAPEILTDLQAMLGDDLVDFPRRGRILLRGRWLRFPIRPFDLLLRLDKRFALGMARDMVTNRFAKPGPVDSYASVLLASLGPTLSEGFYFPYGRKIWGREPHELSGTQARKRVSAGSFSRLLQRLIKPVGGGRFFYPREGFGQISRAYAERAAVLGAEIALGWRATRIERSTVPGLAWTVTAERDGETRTIDCDHLWSTVPIPLLARLMAPPPGPEVSRAAAEITYRAMVLVYVQLPVGRFSETDAHYFPEEHVHMTRLSEPKNYFRSTEPPATTVLCCELPCAIGDTVWSASDGELGVLVAQESASAGIRFPAAPLDLLVRRLPQAYPIYLQGYEEPFARLDAWVDAQPNLLTYGRQGLFAHDNTHHALFMAYSAVDCLDGVRFDRDRWRGYRKVFESHVVDD